MVLGLGLFYWLGLGARIRVVIVIGHLHDGVILLLRPEFFWVFFSYLNLVAPVRFK